MWICFSVTCRNMTLLLGANYLIGSLYELDNVFFDVPSSFIFTYLIPMIPVALVHWLVLPACVDDLSFFTHQSPSITTACQNQLRVVGPSVHIFSLSFLV